MLKDFESSAAALYDGGWRSKDKEEIQTEYEMTEEETIKICEILERYENK